MEKIEKEIENLNAECQVVALKLKELVLEELTAAYSKGELLVIGKEDISAIQEVVYAYYSTNAYGGGTFNMDINDVIFDALRAYVSVLAEPPFEISNHGIEHEDVKMFQDNLVKRKREFKAMAEKINSPFVSELARKYKETRHASIPSSFVKTPIYHFGALGNSSFTYGIKLEDGTIKRITLISHDKILDEGIVEYYVDGVWKIINDDVIESGIKKKR